MSLSSWFLWVCFFQLDFKEWDGLMRICFGRKNRTLHALFRRSSVLSMLESNYKTWCTLNKQVPAPGPFREYCLSVLTETNLENRRSISIDIDTYFRLLLAFNRKGIHFVNVASLPGATAVGASDGAEPMAGVSLVRVRVPRVASLVVSSDSVGTQSPLVL